MKNLIILALFALTSCLSAQISYNKYQDLTYDAPKQDKEDITVKFKVYLDNKWVETNNVFIGYYTRDTLKRCVRINNDFTTFLEPNRAYKLVISHVNYHIQVFDIVTTNKTPVNCTIYLSSKEPDCYLGSYKYNKLLKRYVIND